jgi:hypothetical protein
VDCPVCGGNDVREIAPGFFECVSYNDNKGATCRVRFQTGTSSGLCLFCACGTLAVGRCAECGEPVCGDHSTLWRERRLCSTDLESALQEIADDAKDRVSSGAEEFEALIDSFVSVAANTAEPIPLTSSQRDVEILVPKARRKVARSLRRNPKGWLLGDAFTGGVGGTSIYFYLLPDKRLLLVKPHEKVEPQYFEGPERFRVLLAGGAESWEGPREIRNHDAEDWARAKGLDPRIDWDAPDEERKALLNLARARASLKATAEKHGLPWP